jgi:hypothetical protein
VIGRIIGGLLVAAALLALGAEIVASVEAGAWRPLALGEVWFRLDVGSLNLTQAVIQRYIHPAVWDPVIVFLLQLPAWLVALVPGALILLLSRPRTRRRRRFASPRK